MQGVEAAAGVQRHLASLETWRQGEMGAESAEQQEAEGSAWFVLLSPRVEGRPLVMEAGQVKEEEAAFVRDLGLVQAEERAEEAVQAAELAEEVAQVA